MSLRAEGERWIQQLRLKWVLLSLLQLMAIALGVAVLLWQILSLPAWTILPIGLVLLIPLLFIKPVWKISTKDLSSYLDANFEGLEESASLFLKPEQDMTLLEGFQIAKIHRNLPHSGSLNGALKKTGWGLFFLFGCICLSFLLNRWMDTVRHNDVQAINSNTPIIKENIPSRIDFYELSITPPVYTRKVQRSQRQFSIRAEAGAKVSWKITTNVALKSLSFVFNDKEVQELKPLNAAATEWSFIKIIHQAGFYQLVLDGKKSDLYPIEVIPDLPVQIKIIKPKQNTTIDVGQVPKTELSLILTDDYGISDAFITATMASGKGEGVSFTEKKLAFNTQFNNQIEMRLNKTLDLTALGMKPGDELYFFITAKDNQGQVSRSDVYFVSIVDTSELMSMASINNGVDLVPEYFRSQRQLIIDTEKLLKEQPTISVQQFKEQSNALGMDQKLLRLRYGKFLGEVAETEIGGEHDDDHGAAGGDIKFGDVQAIMDQYSHKHDIAEDATFFEPELKAQLKAVLTEMWSAELQLRTHKPQDALPFEYKALRLLKDLQQKSRAYVAKTTIKTTSLKPEKRLSGILDKITTPQLSAVFEQKDKSNEELKLVLSLLESRKAGKVFDTEDRLMINNAEKHLILAAADQPAIYLQALKNLRTINTAKKVDLLAINQVEQAIQKLIGLSMATPYQQSAEPAAGLYQSYFNSLKKANQ